MQQQTNVITTKLTYFAQHPRAPLPHFDSPRQTYASKAHCPKSKNAQEADFHESTATEIGFKAKTNSVAPQPGSKIQAKKALTQKLFCFHPTNIRPTSCGPPFQRESSHNLSRKLPQGYPGSKWMFTTTKFRHPDRAFTTWSRPHALQQHRQ